jgi:hypothetical protein
MKKVEIIRGKSTVAEEFIEDIIEYFFEKKVQIRKRSIREYLDPGKDYSQAPDLIISSLDTYQWMKDFPEYEGLEVKPKHLVFESDIAAQITKELRCDLERNYCVISGLKLVEIKSTLEKELN